MLSPGQAGGEVQRALDLSIQFDTYSLASLQGATSSNSSAVDTVLREMENTALASFAARNPVTKMNVQDTWYYFNPLFTRSIYTTRSWAAAQLSNYYWWATDSHEFTFKYTHTASRQRNGSFASANGTSRSRTDTLTVGAKVTYGVLELSGSASTATTTGRTSSTTVTTTNYWEHDYDVTLDYKLGYYLDSHFRLRNTFFGPVIDRIGGPVTSEGSTAIGSISVKDDDSNPDNLTP